jgi:hypothetical protein
MRSAKGGMGVDGIGCSGLILLNASGWWPSLQEVGIRVKLAASFFFLI